MSESAVRSSFKPTAVCMSMFGVRVYIFLWVVIAPVCVCV